MELNYEEDRRIDETALDVEWLRQSEIADAYNRNYAKAYKTYELALEEVKTIRSDLIRKANRFPEKTCNKPKPNKEDIEAYYRTHPEYKKAKAKAIEAQYEKDVAEMAKNEINFTRKAALENLVNLLGLGYFAGPRVPRDLQHEAAKRLKKQEASALGNVRKKIVKKGAK